MKPILIAIVAFLASLGAVSGVVALRERDSILAHEAADEAAKHAPPGRPTATVAPAPDPIVEEADPIVEEADPIPEKSEAHTEDLSVSKALDATPETSDEAPSTEAVVATTADDRETATATRPRDLTAPEDPEFSLEGSKRLAKIFSAMKAPDAASVLDGLEDDAIYSILQHITDRKVAEILGNLAAERASALSLLLLESGGD